MEFKIININPKDFRVKVLMEGKNPSSDWSWTDIEDSLLSEEYNYPDGISYIAKRFNTFEYAEMMLRRYMTMVSKKLEKNRLEKLERDKFIPVPTKSYSL